MSEGLSLELSSKAERLRSQHKANAESLDRSRNTFNHAQELRDRQQNGEDSELTYDERVFANGESLQRQMVSSAQLHYDANMWRAREHYLENQATYQEQAKIDAEHAGYEIRQKQS